MKSKRGDRDRGTYEAPQIISSYSRNTNFLGAIVDRFRFRLQPSLREAARSLKWAMVFNLHNPTLRFRLPPSVGMVNDGLHSFKSSGICQGIDPVAATFTSPWVYFRCRKPGPAR